MCSFSSQQWSKDFGRGSGGWESCYTRCCATVRRVRHAVSPRPQRRHCRRAENFTASPSSSGSWSTRRPSTLFFFVLFLSFSVLCYKQGLANSIAPRGCHTNQLTSSDECGQRAFCIACCDLRVLLLFFICLSTLYFVVAVHYPSSRTQHVFIQCAVSPMQFSVEAHTLQPLCLSCRKRRRERDTHPIFPRQRCNDLRGRECVFCQGIPMAAGRMMSSHPQLTSVDVSTC